MSKTFSFSFILIFFCSIVFAQNNINQYKYILVPKQFEFQKSEDQHQLNSLIKFLFNKAGYSVLFNDEKYPEDLATNQCLGLKVNVNNNPSLFKTRMNIDLYDCYNKVVYSTKEATSKEKEYKKAYYDAIRKTFVELEELNYAYNDKVVSKGNNRVEVTEVVEVPVKKNIKVIEKEEVVVSPIKEVMPVKEKKVVMGKVPKEKIEQAQKIVSKKNTKTIEGEFTFDNWGVSTIAKKGDEYAVVGGDENFEFATIYKTSKPAIFIIKWIAYKQPQLLILNSKGNIEIDTTEGIKTVKRIN